MQLPFEEQAALHRVLPQFCSVTLTDATIHVSRVIPELYACEKIT